MSLSVQDLYDEALTQLTSEGWLVTPTRMFGSDGLKVAGKTFAMVVKGSLVVKVPAARVDDLIAAGRGERFDPGHGRPMKEWVSLKPNNLEDTAGYMSEAAAFVEATQARRCAR